MKLTCLVDNAVRPQSPFWGEHGLAFLIETAGARVLFDTGASGAGATLRLLSRRPAQHPGARAAHLRTGPGGYRRGTHLLNADRAELGRLIEVLRGMGPPALNLNHCTGQAAYVALARAFGRRVVPCPAGTVVRF